MDEEEEDFTMMTIILTTKKIYLGKVNHQYLSNYLSPTTTMLKLIKGSVVRRNLPSALLSFSWQGKPHKKMISVIQSCSTFEIFL